MANTLWDAAMTSQQPQPQEAPEPSGLPGMFQDYDLGSRLMMAAAFLNNDPGAAGQIANDMYARGEKRTEARRLRVAQKEFIKKHPELEAQVYADPDFMKVYARESLQNQYSTQAADVANQRAIELAKMNDQVQLEAQQRSFAQQESLAKANDQAQAAAAELANQRAIELAKMNDQAQAAAAEVARQADPNTQFRNQFQQQESKFQLPGAGMMGSEPRALSTAQSMSGMQDMTMPEANQYIAGSQVGAAGQQTALDKIADNRQKVVAANTTNDYANYQLAVKDNPELAKLGFNNWLLTRSKAGATNVTVGGGKYGTIPAGFQLIENKDGSARLEPIPGGPADIETAASIAKQELNARLANRASDTVLTSISDIRNTQKDATIPPVGTHTNIPFIKNVVPGMQDIQNSLNTIKANVSFDKLQQMRSSSETGAALGPVSDYENKMLANAVANLEQSSTPELFNKNLLRVEKIYKAIVHAPSREAQYKMLMDIDKPEAAGSEATSDADVLKSYGIE
jgi:hypothetical protein